MLKLLYYMDCPIGVQMAGITKQQQQKMQSLLVSHKVWK